jgi:hypothetical protein
MKTRAPNIRGNFPLAGKKLAPAWRALWKALDENEWIEGARLATEVSAEYGVARSTVMHLLREARAAELLDVREAPRPGRRPTGEYRVHVPGRMMVWFPGIGSEPKTGRLERKPFASPIRAEYDEDNVHDYAAD